MKILFVAAQLYLPQSYGGVQTSTDQLCRALIERGHKIALLMSLNHSGMLGWRSRIHMHLNKILVKCKVSKDTGFGYPVWRTYFPTDALEYVCKKEKPDLIVVMTGWQIMPVALMAKRTGIPILMQLHDLAFSQDYGKSILALGNVPYIANSHFTAEIYRQDYGISASVIYPFVDTKQYQTQTTKENITFINPVHVKGREIACEIARLCPDIPFSFVKGWALSEGDDQWLESKLSELPNVTLLPSCRNMATVYNKCKILLVPSTFQETFGRVVTEAHACGIPVVASARAGLPETVGPGGILVDPDGPIENWVIAIRKLWQDDKHYAELSTAALAHSRRQEMNFSYQTEAYEKALLAAVSDQESLG